MDINKTFTKKRVIFILLFTILVLIGKQINFSPLVGADNQFFTLFQFFGPIAGGFLGSIIGALAVLFAELINFFVVGKEATLINILRLSPMIFAAYYFGTKKKNLSIIVPIIAIAAFVLHPVGREVWFFTLFWTIPIIAKFFQHHLFIRSLGATFAAHAVGGAIWIWLIPMTPLDYNLLIYRVIIERLLFAAGITISFVAATTLLAKVESKVPFISIDKRYILSKHILKHF